MTEFLFWLVYFHFIYIALNSWYFFLWFFRFYYIHMCIVVYIHIIFRYDSNFIRVFSCIYILFSDIIIFKTNTVKPLNSGQLRVLKNLSVIKSCPPLGGSLTIIDSCSYRVTYLFQSEFTLYSCLNVKELLARSRRKIWNLSDCNWTRTYNHLVHNRTLNH